MYFEKNFLKGTKYPIESWNAYDRIMNNIPLTSNSAEIFHRHFYAKFEQYHPGLTTFIEKLKVHQSITENDIEKSMTAISTIKPGKYNDKINLIKVICQKYESYYDLDYLMLISKLYNWKYD